MTRKFGSKRIAAMLAALAVMASTVLTGAVPASAADPAPSAALSVSPPTTSLDATPGTTMTQKITLANLSDAPRVISVQVQNFSPSGEEGQAQLSEGEGPYALSKWISVSPQTATIPAQGNQTNSQEFEVKINVPKDASPGGHFGAIVFSPAAQAGSGGASLSVVSQVTSLILLRVPGNATEKAGVAGINICKAKSPATTCNKSNGFFQGGPVTFTARLHNDGNVQVQPQGTVTIYNMFGSKVATIKVDQKNLLPDSIRRLDSTWKSGTLFGMYKAHFDLTYGSSAQEIKVDKTFIGFPVAVIGGLFAILLFAFLMFWLPRKRLKKAFKALASSSED